MPMTPAARRALKQSRRRTGAFARKAALFEDRAVCVSSPFKGRDFPQADIRAA
jgi:hypothetical protein